MAVNVIIKGKNNKIRLEDNNFVASGGQGDVYKRDGIIYKIYHNPVEMIPPVKIQELQSIKNKNVLVPHDILVDTNGKVVGFTMPYIDNSVPLCKLFTNSFRNKNGITPEMTLSLVKSMQEIIYDVHRAQCLQIDGNEFNYLTDDSFLNPYFIDTDSYQTPHFPATAIMATIQDYRTKGFSTLTDWFSFGIISFQLFVGIHPFRGGHSKYTNSDLPKRIIDCVSVFNKDVSVPSQARDFNTCIPTAYRDWFYSMFENGVRCEPPKDVNNYVAQTTMNTIIESSSFDFTLKKQMPSSVIFYGSIFGNTVIKTSKSIIVNNRELQNMSPTDEICFTISRNIPIIVGNNYNTLALSTPDNISIKNDYAMMCEEFMCYDNYVYVKYENTVKEIEFVEFQDTVVPNVRKSIDVMSSSTQMFSHIIYQNMFGKAYFIIPDPTNNIINRLFIKELDGYKIVDAKYDKHVAVIIGYKNGIYDRFIIVFNDDFKNYFSRMDNDINYDGINFVALDKGVCVLCKDSSIEMFVNSVKSTSVKILSDVKFTKYPLMVEGNQLLFIRGNDIICATMKLQK